MSGSMFWADQIAQNIKSRKRFRYIKREIPKLKNYRVKTSASLSGVLHIGRLSDTIRGESVARALLDSGIKAELIWVGEDMDPLRKVPEGVPKGYEKYIGMPVTDIPDPNGCHSSYAEHHKSEYFKVLDDFISLKMKKFSMREEYRKGNFRPYIKKILENISLVIEIQNKYRSSPLKLGWSPWTPICERCGKIITPSVREFKDGLVYYKCEDYVFEKSKAKGCGYEGVNDPLEGNGKLLWKSEWASQWTHWSVVSEGAGKEYQVPMSAWWVNAEICERVLEFPMPEPIFYEHLIIEGEKMSASKGNVIYPKDWLEVASPELLRFLYNKKLMKTRSFSWSSLPTLYDDYDKHRDVFFGRIKLDNKKEEKHMKRLFIISQKGRPEGKNIPFSTVVFVSQITRNENDSIEMLKRMGLLLGVSRTDLEGIKKRLSYARKWVHKYAPEMRIEVMDKVDVKTAKKISKRERSALHDLGLELSKDLKEDELYNKFWEIANKNKIKPREFFRACYLVLIGKEQGPRLAPFILAIGRERVAKLLKAV